MKNVVKRPDYGGYVSISEGIQWEKEHPNALKNSTPDNILYVDTSKIFSKLVCRNSWKRNSSLTMSVT